MRVELDGSVEGDSPAEAVDLRQEDDLVNDRLLMAASRRRHSNNLIEPQSIWSTAGEGAVEAAGCNSLL
jgi:hypothetical protein